MFIIPLHLENRLKKAIRSYNYYRDKMAKSGKFDYVPERTSLTKEREFISDMTDLEERLAILERISKEGADDPVEHFGYTIPRYMKNELRNALRQSNDRRAEFRLSFYPDWELMVTPQQYEAFSNRNLEDLIEKDFITSEDFEQLMEDVFPNMPKKTAAYIEVWLDMTNDEETAAMIMEMAENNPKGFRKLMESPDQQKEIEYIYPDEFNIKKTGRSGFRYNRASADKAVGFNERIRNAKDYWSNRYNDYLNDRGYFA